MTKKNLLLVYPEFPDNTYWSFSYALPYIGKKSAMPPLGLITIASMIPENKYDIKLIDMNVESLKDKDIKWADAILTSSMIIQKRSLEDIVKRAKKLNIPVVAGGPLPTQYYDSLEGINHYIIGETESRRNLDGGIEPGILELFLDDFDKNIAKTAYARPIIRKNSPGREIDEAELSNLILHFGDEANIKKADSRPDISDSVVPRFDLLDISKYGSMSVQFSRGCPYDCEFCNEGTLYGHMPRLKSAESMVNELKTLNDLGYRGPLFFVDDNFIGNKPKVKESLSKIIDFQKQNDYPFSLFTEASINLAKDVPLMENMRDAGFSMVFVGIESVDIDVLKSMNKFHNLKTNLLTDVNTIQSYGMEVTAGFIVGNDDDPPDVYEKIFNFCQEAGIPTAMVGQLTAPKGSPLHYRYKKEGRLLSDATGDNTHEFEFNFKLAKGKDEKIETENYKGLLSKLYDKSGRNYYQRCSRLLDNLGKNPKSSREVGINEIKAMYRSLSKQTFRASGYSYGKFLSKSLIKHPKKFPEAVRMAIYGQHFRKITDSAINADSLKNKWQNKLDDFTETFDYLKHSFAEKVEYRKEIMVGRKNKFLERARKKIEKHPIDMRQEKIKSYYDKMVRKKERFLSKAKKNINKFPPDYRPKLKEMHYNVAIKLDDISSKIRKILYNPNKDI